MSVILKGKLFCLHCQKETPHTLIYVGHPLSGKSYLKKIKCENCKTVIELDRIKILEVYSKRMVKRVFTKPNRLTNEIKADLTNFIKSLPIRIITKPYRTAKEIIEIVKD